MCIFSGPVSRVSATRIFARHVGDGRQIVVYSMNVGVAAAVAMVLPIPVAAGSGERAVAFVDLERYPDLFVDLERAFVRPRAPASGRGAPAPLAMARQRLEVHAVGAFVASYVPSPRDFDRLDPAFRLPAPVLAAHADYADWGFVVFQLAPKAGVQTVHPMAFSFPSRRPRAMFFPTLHVHDGATIPAAAEFDHTLLCQTADPVLDHTLGSAWESSYRRAGRFASARRARRVFAPDRHLLRARLGGTRPNADTWIDPPACAGSDVLAGRGDRFAFRLRASAAFPTTYVTPDHAAWRDTARSRIDDLHAGMVAGLRELTARNADAWQLATIPPPPTLWQRFRGDTMRELWLSNNVLYGVMGPHGPDVVAAGTPGPFAIRIAAETARVERQEVELVFRVAPSPDRITEIRAAIATILDNAVS